MYLLSAVVPDSYKKIHSLALRSTADLPATWYRHDTHGYNKSDSMFRDIIIVCYSHHIPNGDYIPGLTKWHHTYETRSIFLRARDWPLIFYYCSSSTTIGKRPRIYYWYVPPLTSDLWSGLGWQHSIWLSCCPDDWGVHSNILNYFDSCCLWSALPLFCFCLCCVFIRVVLIIPEYCDGQPDRRISSQYVPPARTR